MTFNWWWILVGIASIWILGWIVAVICMVFFDPESSSKEKRENWWRRFAAGCVINWFIWPFLLPAFLERRKLHRDMQTGKRPKWIVLDKLKGEESGRKWTLSDGTIFGASVSGGSSTQKSHISADYYDDDDFNGQIEYRVRKIEPDTQGLSEWKSFGFEARGPKPDPDDEDAVDAYVSSRYECSVRLPRGKYEVEFRVANRTGATEICSNVILIVADNKDYNL